MRLPLNKQAIAPLALLLLAWTITITPASGKKPGAVRNPTPDVHDPSRNVITIDNTSTYGGAHDSDDHDSESLPENLFASDKDLPDNEDEANETGAEATAPAVGGASGDFSSPPNPRLQFASPASQDHPPAPVPRVPMGHLVDFEAFLVRRRAANRARVAQAEHRPTGSSPLPEDPFGYLVDDPFRPLPPLPRPPTFPPRPPTPHPGHFSANSSALAPPDSDLSEVRRADDGLRRPYSRPVVTGAPEASGSHPKVPRQSLPGPANSGRQLRSSGECRRRLEFNIMCFFNRPCGIS